MENYKINDSRQEPTEEQLNAGKNFTKVKEQSVKMKRNRQYRNITIGLSGVLVMVASLLFLNKSEKKDLPKARPVVQMNEPKKGDLFLIDASRDTSIIYQTGSIIHIPAGAFARKNGEKISGMVELSYREFHNPSEIIMADIPMTYDSAGKQYHFESAGMFEIKAFQDQEVLQVAQDKSIVINLVSLNDELTKFNQYYFNEQAARWEYLRKDNPQAIPLKPVVAQENKIEKQVPFIKPTLLNKKRQQFKINFNAEEFPELDAMQNVIFEVAEQQKDFDPNTANQTWDEVSIKRNDEAEVEAAYIISFMNKNSTYEIWANPVVNSEDYAVANLKWEKLYQRYESVVKSNHKKKDEQRKKLEAEIATNKAIQARYTALAVKNVALSSNVITTETIVYRTFQVRNFGMWNSDCPSSMPTPGLLSATYKTNKGTYIDVAKVFLIEHGKNAVFSLYGGEKVYFNPKSENTLLVISRQNEIGVISKEEFMKLSQENKIHTFIMEMNKKENVSIDELNKLI